MKLELFYPVKPYHANQQFGGNPDYYARFKDRFGNPMKGHMGQDMAASHGQPVYAACDGMASFSKDEHGGEGIIIHTALLDYGTQKATFNIINWHLVGDTDPKYPSPFPTDGSAHAVKAGDLIGYADNTGAPFESSGDHLHLGLCPFDVNNNAIEAHNGFNGCIDPNAYFNGYYAANAQSVLSILQSEISAYQKVVALLQKLIQK